jgi:tetratricopeptide (TPR) repeat protein
MPAASWAFNFVPKRTEWDSWPPHCKARYSISSAADGTEFARLVPADEVQRWRAQTGDFVWSHMHHYCAGIAWQFRARLEVDPARRTQFLETATREVEYTYRHLEPGMPLYSTVSIAMGSVWADRRQYSRATGYLKGAISAQPAEPSGYVALASVYQKQKRLDLAKATLLEGDEASDGSSAEIAYYLGLVSLDLGQKDAALEYARKAYGMGYPLPGLRRKLNAAGMTL